jgi:hypothetical protein
MVPDRVFGDRRIRERGLRIFGAICGRAGPDPEKRLDPDHYRVAFAWNKELGDAIGIDPRGIATETKKLQLTGYILIKRGRHRGRGTKYIILMSCPDVSFEQPKDTPRREETTRPDVQNVTPGRDPYTESQISTDARSTSEPRARALRSYPKNQSELLMAIPGGVSASSAHSRNGEGKRNGKTGISVDWSLPDDDRDYARRAGLDDQGIAIELEKCRNYHSQSGKDAAYSSAKWRRWVDLAPHFNGQDGTGRKAGAGNKGPTAIASEILSDWRLESG